MPPRIVPFAGMLVSLVAAATDCSAQPAPGLRLVAESRLALAQDGVPRVERAYFDASGRLRWDDRVLATHAAAGCEAIVDAAGYSDRVASLVRNRLRLPRVDEIHCPETSSGRHRTDAALVGFGPDGQVKWRRDLAFISGDRTIDRRLIGATQEGLVLSDLEVWSAATGETILPARLKRIESENRAVPEFFYAGAAIYDPRSKQLLVFDADVSLLNRRGGIYRVDPGTGVRELILPVSATLLGSFDRVESMALDGDRRRLFLAQRLAVRGPSSVSIAVLDLESRRVTHVARHGEGHACADAQIVRGGPDEIAFSYRDDTLQARVLMHYHLAP